MTGIKHWRALGPALGYAFLLGALNSIFELIMFRRAAQPFDVLAAELAAGWLVAFLVGALLYRLFCRELEVLRTAQGERRASEARLADLLDGAGDAVVAVDENLNVVLYNRVAEKMFGFPAEEMLGQPLNRLLPSAAQAAHSLHISAFAASAETQRPMAARRAVTGRRKDGTEFPAEVSISKVQQDGSHTFTAIVRDVTEDREAGAALERRVEERTREIERRRRVAEGLQETMRVLNSGRSLDEVLQSVTRQAVANLQAHAVSVFERQGEDLRLRAYAGLDVWPANEVAFSLGQGPLGRAILERRTVALSDTRQLLAAAAHAEVPAALRDVLAAAIPRHRALLAVPLVVKDELFGAISLTYSEPREFCGDDLELAGAFAGQAALAIENARLRAQVEQVAVMEERSRLARDLHDSVTQSLYSLTLLAEATRRLVAREDRASLEKVRRYAERLGQAAQQALKEMRSLVYALRPLSLDQQGLVAALRQRLQSVEARAGVETRLQVEGEIKLPEALEEETYRIAVEALNNALKHAAANCVEVALSHGRDGFELTVADDGVGFDVAAAGERGGLGLSTMQERAAALGGRLQVISAPHAGTRVHLRVDI